jgi:hypothetical protein
MPLRFQLMLLRDILMADLKDLRFRFWGTQGMSWVRPIFCLSAYDDFDGDFVYWHLPLGSIVYSRSY